MTRHRRFVARAAQPARRVRGARGPAARAWLGLSAAAALALVLWLRHAPAAITDTVAQRVPTAAALHVFRTSQTWHGDPLFRIANGSAGALRQVVVENWRNQALPIYAVGHATPTGLPSPSSAIFFPAMPITLAVHESLWFVGPRGNIRPFTVLWLTDGLTHYFTSAP